MNGRRVARAGAIGALLLLACTVRPAGDRSAAAELRAAPAPTPAADDTAGGGARRGRPLELWFTGSDDGYLDACGCDDGLLGGLPRRATLLKFLKAGDDEALVLSNGRLVAGAEPLDQMKLDVIALAMAEMGYLALAVTERELALGRDALVDLAGLLGSGDALLGTNLIDLKRVGSYLVSPALAEQFAAAVPLPTVPALARTVRGEPLLVLSAISPQREALYHAADPLVQIGEPVRALQEQLALHPEARSIVLAQMSEAEAQALAGALPELDLIVVQGPEHEDFPREEATTVGTTSIVTTGRKGKFLMSFRFGGGGEIDEAKRHPIVDTLEKDPSIQELLNSLYRERLFVEKPIEQYYARREPAGGARYAGAEEGSCASCHPKAWETWGKSKHAHAWQTLVDQDLPPKPEYGKSPQKHAVWDPDCVRCHVTGFGEVSGYAGVERERPEARLVDVGCEACHGPAGDHAERASQGDPRWPHPPIGKIDDGSAEAMCMKCHDPDNSPHFVMKEYWRGLVRGEQRPSIAHGREGD
ncbi:MAG: hypothetical protein JNL90_13295 [Planctomycetes bacterium]|nr:hypothetical protein [Planctomycetota bacterium]